MKKYPAWRYALLLIVLGVGILYALPNLYPAQPAIQVTYTDSAKSADQKLLSIIQSELFDAGIITEDLSLKNNNIVVRFQSLDDQLLAKSLLQKTLLDQIIVALKLEPTTPDWLANLGGQPLKLGLDLSGGVHFLLEVDVETALNDKTEGLLNSYRKKFRTEKISYSQSQVIDKQLIFVFRDQDSFSRAKDMFFDDSFTATGLQYDLEESASTQTLKLAYSDLAIKELRDYAVQQNLMTLRNRVNELGVSEPVVQRQGANRIVVELPGVQDTTSAKKIIGKTANLEFRLEARSETSRLRKTEFEFKNSNFGSAYLENDVIVTGDRVTNANTGFDENGQAQVNITLDMQGGRAMQRATDGNIGRRLGVLFVEQKSSSSLSVDETGQEVIAQASYVEKNIISLATVQAVLGTNFRITGVGTPQEASELALLLRAGALAAPMTFVEERTVGPSLGKENIKLGMQSIIAGFALVILFMFIYYKFFGLAANLALTSNLILITGFMSLLGATLTLPGIAGIVLTVGMAVDANVLIFSRIREELKAGKNPHLAIQDGFSRAFITIFDANVTTLIAALILYAIGTGPIKGFAVTLSIGILTSMFTAIMGTRAIVQLMYGNRSLRELKI
jgi:preprotein translocase subunit SecD